MSLENLPLPPFRSRTLAFLAGLLPALLSFATTPSASEFTRGVGVYPGEPAAYQGPLLVVDKQTYRNLALHRPASASSTYDYNLTAQLVTDGIVETHAPSWLVTTTSAQGVVPRDEREALLDHNPWTGLDLPGSGGWVQLEQAGGPAPRPVDHIVVTLLPRTESTDAQNWTCTLLSSQDGSHWSELGHTGGVGSLAVEAPWKPQLLKADFDLPAAAQVGSRFYRVTVASTKLNAWTVAEFTPTFRGSAVELAGPYTFSSAWKSAGKGSEWIQVDLGAPCTFDRITLHWLARAAAGAILASNDTSAWHEIAPLAPNADDYRLPEPVHARYVRVRLDRPVDSAGYLLSELQVFGAGGPIPVPQAAPQARPGLRQDLVRGNWRLQRASLVALDGAALSQTGVDCTEWLPATVPGTVLASYLNAGALPDPNFGENQLAISDSYFYADFWYRDEFIVPRPEPGRTIWLNLDGINWKADVYFNGAELGHIDGAFTRARFDVTRLVRPGAANALAVLIRKPAHPGSVHEKTAETPGKNGGILGADNPTFHASVGWDWIPTVRGREIGIWSDVFLTTTGPVTVENPHVTTTLPLPDTSSADVAIDTTLSNHSASPVRGVLRGRFGDASFAREVEVPAKTSLAVHLDPASSPALRLRHPRLWWPAGYGRPDLYDVDLQFVADGGAVSDTAAFKAGVRQYAYSTDGGALKIFINGRRLVPRGGNWGFAESNLLYRAREYDAAVRYHADMGFTMIRNWVGQVGDDAFFDACDRHGVVVWQDFWLANPFDGPDPDDNAMFLQNAADFIDRIRNHPSVGLYCGRNEGYPPPALEQGLSKLVAERDPEIHYIPHSAADGVSGGGPYHLMPLRFYFDQRATPKLHSELGMPVIPDLASLRLMMPAGDQWPQGADWGLHDFTRSGAQGGDSLRNIIEKSYGPASSAAEWTELAQFTNYDGYRAMFEAQGRNRMGVLLWMSHPCWPSFVWQTYDYYLDPTAAYFGAKKACEPLHVQWNRIDDAVEVVNTSAGRRTGLRVTARVVNLDGSVRWEKSAVLDSAEDSLAAPFRLEFPASGLSTVHFVRLELRDAGRLVSLNTYLRSLKTYEIPGYANGSTKVPAYPEYDFRDIRRLPKAGVNASTSLAREGVRWVLTTILENPTRTPALLVHVEAVRSKSGDRILPALYSDNYLTLLPGERREVTTEVSEADTRGETPRIAVDGFNVAAP